MALPFKYEDEDVSTVPSESDINKFFKSSLCNQTELDLEENTEDAEGENKEI